MKTVLVVYSGNGNTKYIAENLGLEEAEIHFTEEFIGGAYTLPEDTERLGLLTPVYNSGLPYPMYDFITHYLEHRDNISLEYLFAIITYSRNASYSLTALDKVLMNSGLNLAYHAAIKMPETNLKHFSHPLSEMKTLAAVNKEVNEIKKIASDIKKGEIKIIHNLPFSSLSIRSSKRKNMPHAFKSFKVNDRCNGCEICRKVCPMDNIRMHNGKPVFLTSCIECFACYNRCPVKAIDYKRVKGQYKGLIETEELIRR